MRWVIESARKRGENTMTEKLAGELVLGAEVARDQAAERGHEVHLHEREAQTGGQARLAQLLPKRAEFGGMIDRAVDRVAVDRAAVPLGAEVADIRHRFGREQRGSRPRQRGGN